jgi:hypothetical protein
VSTPRFDLNYMPPPLTQTQQQPPQQWQHR